MELNTTLKNSAENLPQDKMVVGANTLAHFNVRCPACDKLFRVDSREIKSSTPQFDCTSCKVRFTFDFPPVSANKVETRTVSMKETYQNLNAPTDQVDFAAIAGLKDCPKCATKNPRLVKECIKCGVLFNKVENLPLETSLGAFPSLVKAWQELMSDYNNMTKHVAFVDRCEDLQALPFALKKYETLKEVQPTDKLALEMFHKVLIRKMSRRADRISWVHNSKEFLTRISGKINWPRVRKVSPFALSLAMIIVGLSSHAARNLAGMGAALLFLTIGLTVFIKGRIDLADFW